jgi:GT2 family glycosyltransferase/glycosyltransferase involved in cell wall biosynthesis
MNICHILRRIYQREGQEFVAELYRELLNREPNHGELLLHVNMLSTGHSKISIVSQILSSQEAHDILISPSPPLPTGAEKIIHILYRALRTGGQEFVAEMYRQLLGRNPDAGGLRLHRNLVASNISKIDIVKYILSSQEANSLLTSPLVSSGTSEASGGRDSVERETLMQFMRYKLRAFLENEGARLTLPPAVSPVVSIILVLFNKAEYTYQCLETIKSHADVPYEVIIVDNGSTDSTVNLLQKTENCVIISNPVNHGFINGSNQGANAARGKWLLFLNNDTQITPTLLSSLIQTAEQTPQCGAVGGKLIFPNGSLQEAGCTIWQDGTCMGYGRGDDPYRPEFSFVRDVYFCSGACLCVRRDLFMQVGMFDAIYGQAYYEDVDLCMKIRQLGYRVLYQPSAMVIHYEFGTSRMEDAMAQQSRNHAVFTAKWRDQLAGFLSADKKRLIPARELHRDQKIKVLFIEDRIPATELGSGYPRSLKIVECLADLGYRVTLFPLLTSTKIQPYTHALQQKGVEVMFTNDGSKLDFRGFYENRKDDYHLVWVSRPHNLQEVIHVIQSLNPYQKIIYDAEALFSMREILQSELSGHPLTPERKAEMIHAEVQWMRQANAVVAVSDLEKQIMESHGVRNVNVIGYPVRPNPTPKTFEERRDILFTGGFLVSPCPNEDAIVYFVRHIYPSIYQSTGAHLWIVGTNHLNSIRQLASDHIFVTGQVADLTPFYNDCRVFVAPTRYAAGIPLKMMEALAHGIPSVVTSLIGEQLGIDESSALIAQDGSSFGGKVLECYSNKNIWQTLRDNGLQYVQSRCNEANFSRDLASLITGV